MTPRTSLSSLPLLAICPGSASLPRTASVSAESRYGDAGHEMIARIIERGGGEYPLLASRMAMLHDLEPPHARDLATVARLLRLPVPAGALAEVALGLFKDGSVRRIEGGNGRYEDVPGLILPGTVDAMWAEPDALIVEGASETHDEGMIICQHSILWVVDWKFGSPDNVAPVERNRQIRAAALLAARWTGATRVIPALCYLDASEALDAAREGREYQGRWDVEMQDGAPRVFGVEELAGIEREVRAMLSAAGIGGSDVREEDLSCVRTGECGAHEERDHTQGPRARAAASSGPGTGEEHPPSPHAGADAHGSGDGGGLLRQALKGGEDVSNLCGHSGMLDGSRRFGAGEGGELAHEGRDGEDRARHLVLATPRFVTGSHCDHCDSAGACPAWGGLVRAALSMRAEGQRDDPGAMPGAWEPGGLVRDALGGTADVAGTEKTDPGKGDGGGACLSVRQGQWGGAQAQPVLPRARSTNGPALTPAERPRLLAMMRAARRAADAIQLVLRADGPVQLPGGKVYAPALEEVREFDPGIALGVLMAEVGDDAATKAAGVTWASLARALEGQSREVRRRVYEAIEEAGGVKATWAERWRERQQEASVDVQKGALPDGERGARQAGLDVASSEEPAAEVHRTGGVSVQSVPTMAPDLGRVTHDRSEQGEEERAGGGPGAGRDVAAGIHPGQARGGAGGHGLDVVPGGMQDRDGDVAAALDAIPTDQEGCLVQGGDRRAKGQEAEGVTAASGHPGMDTVLDGAPGGVGASDDATRGGDGARAPVRSHARGVCAHCGVEIAVNKGGVARTHIDKRPAAHGSRCEGSALAARPLSEQQSIEGT